MNALLRYYGAKNRISTWIASYFPEHEIYVEPFGGSGAVLFNKAPARKMEVYNDKFQRVYNFFKVLREREEELVKLVELTPYHELEYDEAKTISEDDLEDARRMAVIAYMSYGGGKNNPGFQRGGRKRHTPCPRSWTKYPSILREAIQFFKDRDVEIHNTDASRIIKLYDSPSTLHYLDPPYTLCRRGSGRYEHDFTDEDHIKLLELSLSLEGKVAISSYKNDLYDTMLKDWRVEMKEARTLQCKKTFEYLYLNF